MNETNHANIKAMSFDQIFTQISPKEINDNSFALLGYLVGKDMVITAGKQ